MTESQPTIRTRHCGNVFIAKDRQQRLQNNGHTIMIQPILGKKSTPMRTMIKAILSRSELKQPGL